MFITTDLGVTLGFLVGAQFTLSFIFPLPFLVVRVIRLFGIWIAL
jgi:hypothetical protein